MAIIELTAQDFDQTIERANLAVVDFWAPWCGPCLAFASIFAQVSQRHPDGLFAKVNIDEEKQLADDFNISSIPFIMIFRHEFAVFAQAGVQSATGLHQLILDAKKIDLAQLKAQKLPTDPTLKK